MIKEIIKKYCKTAIDNLYHTDFPVEKISIQATRKDLNGDFTLVVFPLLSLSKKSAEETAKDIGNLLMSSFETIASYEVVKGFLNLSLAPKFWTEFAQECLEKEKLVLASAKKERILLEYSSPNTNKPLHLGHIRNNLLGASIANILQAVGHDVYRLNLVNDRGIHICKSMLAWIKWGNGETPETSGMKGDHLVGKYYVLFDKKYKEEIAVLMKEGMEEEEAKKQAPILIEAQEMLRKWEKQDKEVIHLWKTMNAWVYEGFDVTYKKMGISFDKTYYESETYLLGKQMIKEALAKKIVYQKEDGSIWIDLSAEEMDDKLLLRADGTAVYMTQDLGTAKMRYEEWDADSLAYVVGNEQIHHFNVLKLVLKKLSFSWYNCIKHIAYGMVELPDGKMKSREGTVVDADDIMEEMIATAKEKTTNLGKIEGFEKKEAESLYYQLGLGAIKYFILKVDPKKNMLFNPEESIDFNGNTAAFIQYTHARICSLLRKGKEMGYSPSIDGIAEIHPKEKQLLIDISQFNDRVHEAAKTYNPALIANYAYELVKNYNAYYQEVPVLKEKEKSIVNYRMGVSALVKRSIAHAMQLLGIEVPERM